MLVAVAWSMQPSLQLLHVLLSWWLWDAHAFTSNPIFIVLADHHHLASALSLTGVTEAACHVVRDLSHTSPDEFWRVMNGESGV